MKIENSLDTSHLLDALHVSAKDFFPAIELFQVIPSTNDYLLQRIREGVEPGTVCIAEGQTAGRGRRGKSWVSPVGENIYCSFYFRYEGPCEGLSGLSLVVGLGILEGLKSLGKLPDTLGVKWPNDIWHDEAKLGGVLIETVPQVTLFSKKQVTDVVVGMGINVRMSQGPSDCKWTDLTRILGKTPCRNTVISSILNALAPMLIRFQQGGLSPFLPQWKTHDVLWNKEVQVLSHQGIQIGIARGINAQGELLVQGEEGLTAVRSAEVSIGID